MGVQDDMNSFYDVDNLVTVKIDLPTWEDLKNAEPRGQVGYIGHRYDWHKATSITVSGTKFPKTPVTFKDVGVIKKSYWGSFDKEKPSMRVDFERFDDSNGKGIEKVIGTRRITLNNCKQDPGYLRQPLCYELLRQAGVPNFRCNFVKVFVNDTDMGLYVNLEPFRKPYVKRNFKNDDGNAYEIDFGQDINAETLEAGNLSFEGFSKFKDKKDINMVASILANEGLAGVRKTFDWDALMRFWAMEILIKHRDGYTCHQNNTFAYNNVKAVADPTEKDLNFTFVPSGVDLTLSTDPKFYMGIRALVAKLVGEDDAATKELLAQVKKYMDTVFSADNYKNTVEPFIGRLENTMKAAGVQFDETITKEFNIAKASIQAAGTDAANPVKKP